MQLSRNQGEIKNITKLKTSFKASCKNKIRDTIAIESKKIKSKTKICQFFSQQGK